MLRLVGGRVAEYADHMHRELISALDREGDPQPRFDFVIGWSQSYDDLFLGRFSEQTDMEAIINKAPEKGRVLLTGRGGGAKTVIIRRLARIAVDRGLIPILIDLKRWSAPDYDTWDALGPDRFASMDFLLQRFAVPRAKLADLAGLPPPISQLLLVDGLNEVSSTVGQEIIETLDHFVQRALQASTIVTDRLVRREFREPSRWRLAVVTPLTEHEIRRHLGKRWTEADAATRAMLPVPYFLDSLLKGRAPPLRDYFTRHASLAEEELTRVSVAAFKAYERSKARVFSLSDFRRDAGDRLVEKLTKAGDLVINQQEAYFDHHLKHDYLTSLYVAAEPGRWARDVFDTVTFFASSFDALAMALEELQSTEEADEFVRRLHDWNQYAAAYVVAEGRHRQAVRISGEMETALLAMLAERRWDIITSTAQRVKDALSLFPPSDVTAYLGAGSPQALFELVLRTDSSETWFNDWRELFTRAPRSPASDEDIELIRDADSIMGWTSANVLKRMLVSNEQQEILRSLLGNEEPTIRWRVVHVLGAFAQQANAAALFRSFESDQDDWVRYGATRSLVEMAVAASPELREAIITGLQERAAGLAQNAHVLREFERAIFVDTRVAPSSWGNFAISLIERLYEVSDSVGDRTHWERIAHRLKTEYGS